MFTFVNGPDVLRVLGRLNVVSGLALLLTCLLLFAPMIVPSTVFMFEPLRSHVHSYMPMCMTVFEHRLVVARW